MLPNKGPCLRLERRFSFKTLQPDIETFVEFLFLKTINQSRLYFSYRNNSSILFTIERMKFELKR